MTQRVGTIRLGEDDPAIGVGRDRIFQAVQARVDLTAVLERYGYELPRGPTVSQSIPCPFHEDTRPSFYIYTDENKGFCFGGCRQQYGALDIVEKHEGTRTIEEAVRILEAAFGVSILGERLVEEDLDFRVSPPGAEEDILEAYEVEGIRAEGNRPNLEGWKTFDVLRRLVKRKTAAGYDTNLDELRRRLDFWLDAMKGKRR